MAKSDLAKSLSTPRTNVWLCNAKYCQKALFGKCDKDCMHSVTFHCEQDSPCPWHIVHGAPCLNCIATEWPCSNCAITVNSNPQGKAFYCQQ